MNGPANLWIAVVCVPLVIGTAVYVIAVLDRTLGAWVGGRPLSLSDALMGPVRSGALRYLQARSSTERPDPEAWALAPALLGAIAAVALASIPLGASFAVADIPEGIVLFGAAMALVMVAVFLHGWSPNSALPLIGGYRFIALALSYEMPLALVLIAAALPAESLSVGAIIRSQAEMWNVVRQPLGLPIYLVPALGLAFWGPLALPDARDLAGGTMGEVSGTARLAWSIARAAVLFAAAAMGAAVFLGGWLGPALPGPVWMALKTLALLIVLLAAGHLIGRVRTERFVVLAWTILIPLALLDVFVSGTLALLAR